jgi:acetyl-CoA carboxylase carboxyl transferase subunit alpha
MTASLQVGTALEFEKPLVRMEREIIELESQKSGSGKDQAANIKQMRTNLTRLWKQTYADLSPWQTVLVARHPQRPGLRDYLRGCVKDFCELHGDRNFGDDKAMVTGFGRIGGHKALFVGHDKGSDTKQKIERNFGCVHPEGYRKALLKMKLAEKFELPIVCVIDTQGAFPGDKAEERGIAQAIAVNLMEMSRMRVPICCLVIGEGGSGGALGIGVGDRLGMFEHAYYSVITPEGCAAILFKTAERAPQAADALRLTSRELKKLNLIDDILPEPLGGGHRGPTAMMAGFEQYIGNTLRDLKRTRIESLLKRRYERLRNLGSFFESQSAGKPKASSTNGSATAGNGSRAGVSKTNGARSNGSGTNGSGRAANGRSGNGKASRTGR